MEIINKRIDELLADAIEIEKSKSERYSSTLQTTVKFVDDNLYTKWLIKLESLLISVSGESSVYTKKLMASKKANLRDGYSVFKQVETVGEAFFEDYKKGYITEYSSLIQSDIFDSELEQAKELLDKNYISASAVIAGTVLETFLRNMCKSLELDIGKLDFMNANLAKAGFYNKNQQKAITALAGTRNSAAHGDYDAFNKDDVKNLITQTEAILAKHLN